MDSTLYSLCNAFADMGSILGLSFTRIVLILAQFYIIAFVFIAIISNLGFIGVLLLNLKEYEL